MDLVLRMAHKSTQHAEFIGYHENMQIPKTEKAVKGTERKTGVYDT